MSVSTIELKPTRQGYIQMLETIIEGSTNKNDVEWAKETLKNYAPEVSHEQPAKANR